MKNMGFNLFFLIYIQINTIKNYTTLYLNLNWVKLDKCVGSCNTLNNLSKRICVSDNAEDLNIQVFDMITKKNESKIIPNDIS